MRFYHLILIFVFLLLTSCVSKKKHLEAIQALKMDHQASFTSETNRLKRDINHANDTIIDLRLLLAERKGENNILNLLRSELESKISLLELDLESMGKSSASSQQNLSSSLSQKESEIARLNGLIKKVDTELDQYVNVLEILAGELDNGMYGYDTQNYAVARGYNQVRFNIMEALLFKSTSRLSDSAFPLLEKFSGILKSYPTMNIQVVGHTDTSTPKKTYKDNWNVSLVRSAAIIRVLTDEYGMNANQLLAAGMGEYSPFTSNETAEGRLQNRRIEFIISPRSEELVKVIRRSLQL